MNKTLREKIEDILYTFYHNEAQDIEDSVDKILNLISKEIKKNGPKGYDFIKKEGYYEFTKSDGTVDTALQFAYNQALKEYDGAIADTLK